MSDKSISVIAAAILSKAIDDTVVASSQCCQRLDAHLSLDEKGG